jgi:DNA-binding response OmpR family regulator
MPKILIIDDDESIVEVLTIVLTDEGWGVEVDMAGTYFDSLKYELPDLVLLDLRLKGRNGGDICLNIKTNPKTSSLPVLLVSANTPAQVQETAKNARADGFITKPFDIDDLVKTIRNYLPK